MKIKFRYRPNKTTPAFLFWKQRVLLLQTCILLSISGALYPQQSKSVVLQSGEPVPNAGVNGVGDLCVPFYGGSIMGLSDVNGDGMADLWLQGVNGGARGIYLYYSKKLSENGVPVFSQPVMIATPFEDKGNNMGVIFQDDDANIYALWKFGSEIKWCLFDKKKLQFSPLSDEVIKGVPPGTTDFNIVRCKDAYFFLFSVTGKGNFGPGGDWPRVVQYTPEGFWPYDLAEAGVYGEAVKNWKSAAIKPKLLTSANETYYSLDGFDLIKYPDKDYILSGSRLGNLYAYEITGGDKLAPVKYIVNNENNLHRNPTVHSHLRYFKGPRNNNGIVTIGEGGIYFYRDKQQRDTKGNLLFDDPVPLLQEGPLLDGGSLVVPNLVDWDGDGVLDIISGTSAGFIFFFKNKGTNAQPLMQNAVPLKAGGYIIHIQPGYREDIQGPGEARWGYSSPNVVDWNGDGLLDIVLGDSRGKFTVYINKGTKQQPELVTAKPVFIKGMNMFGSWRVRPGVGMLGKRMAFINQDQDDELHLYWQIDDYNVEDGGKLTIEGNMPVKGARLPAGAVGRTRIEIVDWDGDGIKDLMLGTYGKQSIPEPVSGMPFHFPKRGSTALFLKNTGTEENPVYAYPKPVLFKGKHILLGGHECGVATGYFGPGNTLNMVIGEENGKYMFYQRKDLTW